MQNSKIKKKRNKKITKPTKMSMSNLQLRLWYWDKPIKNKEKKWWNPM